MVKVNICALLLELSDRSPGIISTLAESVDLSSGVPSQAKTVEASEMGR